MPPVYMTKLNEGKEFQSSNIVSPIDDGKFVVTPKSILTDDLDSSKNSKAEEEYGSVAAMRV